MAKRAGGGLGAGGVGDRPGAHGLARGVQDEHAGLRHHGLDVARGRGEAIVGPGAERLAGAHVHEDPPARAPRLERGGAFACGDRHAQRRGGRGRNAERGHELREVVDQVVTGERDGRRGQRVRVGQVRLGLPDAPSCARGQHEQERRERLREDHRVDHGVVPGAAQVPPEPPPIDERAAVEAHDGAHGRLVQQDVGIHGRSEHIEGEARIRRVNRAQHPRAHDHVANAIVTEEEDLPRHRVPVRRVLPHLRGEATDERGRAKADPFLDETTRPLERRVAVDGVRHAWRAAGFAADQTRRACGNATTKAFISSGVPIETRTQFG